MRLSLGTGVDGWRPASIAAPIAHAPNHAPPSAAGRLPDLAVAQNSGVHMVDAFSDFTGQGLTFAVAGPGVTVDPATGRVAIPTDALVAGIEVVVTARNSGGTAESRFRLSVVPATPAAVPPASLVAPALGGSGVIGVPVEVDPGTWSGEPAPALTLQWRAGGVVIPGATGTVFVPTNAEDGAELDCLVTATNAAGNLALAAGPLRVRQVPPAVVGTLSDLALVQGGAAARVAAAGVFSGAALRFAVEGAGAVIDALGVVTVPADRVHAAEAVTVTAWNSGGAATAVFRVTVAEPAPKAVPPASLVAPALGGSGVIGAPVEVDPGTWSGEPAPALTLEWRAGGVAIPGAAGMVFVPTDAEDGAELDCLVTAANAAGSLALAAGPLRVRQVPPAVTGAVSDLALVQGAPAARVAAAGVFSGAALSFAVEGAGAVIEDGAIVIPTGVLLTEEPVAVTARNSGGAATAVFRVSVTAAPALPAAPVAVGVLPDLVLEQGAGVRTVSAQAGFAGEDLVFALAEAPAGITIESGSGLVRIPTDAPIAAARVTVQASNAGGAAGQSFAVTVRSTASVFDTAAALGELALLYYGAPAWSLQPEGFARLAPVKGGRVHSAWSKATGDGRYRCLARWSAATDQGGARPFSFNARLSKVKPGWDGLKVDALQASDGTRSLEIAQYVTADTKASVLATAAVAWQWDAWYWIEVEVDGGSVRARLYPEAAAAPDWQVAATTSFTSAGAFGPGGFPLSAGGPNIDIRRLEFVPLTRGSEGVPPAATDADWSLGQFTESK
jgi:hypothetical protein